MTAKRISENVIANLLGKGCSAFLSFAFTPLYLHYVGLEGIGLISFFNLILALSFSLDFGVGIMLNREIARLNAEEKGKAQIYSLIKGFEKWGFFISCSYGIVLVFISSFLAKQWLNFKILSLLEVKMSVALMGVVLIVQWPIFLYQHVLLGLEKQKLSNFLLVGGSLLRHGGAFICLVIFSHAIFAFFIWQCVASFIQFFAVRFSVFKDLPRLHMATFEWKAVKQFSLNMGGVALVSIVFSYFDKVFLSKVLSLEDFGIYSMSAVLAGGILFLAYPFFYAYLPRFTALFAQRKMDELKVLFLSASKKLIALLAASSALLFFFSWHILFFWTGSRQTASDAQECFCILLSGNLLFSGMILSYCLQTAIGEAKSYMKQILLGVCFLIPSLWILVPIYGLKGAAIACLMANGAFCLACLLKIKKIMRSLRSYVSSLS